MSWLLYRQHRMQGALAGIALAAFAILLWVTGVHMANTYHSALATCNANGTCDNLDLFRGDGALIDVVNLSIAVPLLMGLFWGATLLGREFETGTHTLVWMQGVRRRDWLRDKIILLLVAALLWGAAVSALVTWWSGTFNSLNGNRFDPAKFDIQGIVPVAYSLFAVALGLAMGALLRRVLPALAATLVGYVALRVVIANYVRPHYLTAHTLSTPLKSGGGVLNGAWVLSQHLQVGNHTVDGPFPFPLQCRSQVGKEALSQCLGQAGFRNVTTYQPASRYWTFQFIEAGIFIALAAGLVAVAVYAVRRRDA